MKAKTDTEKFTDFLGCVCGCGCVSGDAPILGREGAHEPLLLREEEEVDCAGSFLLSSSWAASENGAWL